MTNKTLQLDDALYEYMLKTSLREPEVLQQLREETAQHGGARMQIAPEQGQFMAMLVRLLGAKKILEFGTFTGYSSTVMALAMAEGGQLITCDVNEKDTAIARRYWETAGVAEKISLRLGPALETASQLVDGGEAGTFDLVFIDADKRNYRNYYEKALVLLRAGGLVILDNVLWSGQVAQTGDVDARTAALQKLNTFLHTDSRVELSMLPVADGLTLALKK